MLQPMLTCAVIQPSYMPWRGYFDMILRSDLFIFYDDVQYDKHGWRNRNRIKTKDGPVWLTIPVRSSGNIVQRIPIHQIEISNETRWNRKHVTAIRQSYAKAPFMSEYLEVVERHLHDPGPRLVDLTIPLTIDLARVLGAGCKFLRSSELAVAGHGLAKLLSTLETVGATNYLSGPSAADYIDPEQFSQRGIGLEYLRYSYPPYEQLHPPYDPQVSIIDLLFMLGPDALTAFRNPP